MSFLGNLHIGHAAPGHAAPSPEPITPPPAEEPEIDEEVELQRQKDLGVIACVESSLESMLAQAGDSKKQHPVKIFGETVSLKNMLLYSALPVATRDTMLQVSTAFCCCCCVLDCTK